MVFDDGGALVRDEHQVGLHDESSLFVEHHVDRRHDNFAEPPLFHVRGQSQEQPAGRVLMAIRRRRRFRDDAKNQLRRPN
jgi:hypothetical protein